MTNLFDPPPIFTLPLSKGGDLHVTFVYKPLLTDEGGDPVLDDDGNRQYVVADYPDGASVAMAIETDGDLVTADAEIAGALATVWEDTTVADPIKSGSLWRVTITFADGLDQVMCNGTVTRYDGKKPR